MRSWADVAERAEIAGYYLEAEGSWSYFEGGVVPLPPDVDDNTDCRGDAAAKAGVIHLIRAALQMGGANV